MSASRRHDAEHDPEFRWHVLPHQQVPGVRLDPQPPWPTWTGLPARASQPFFLPLTVQVICRPAAWTLDPIIVGFPSNISFSLPPLSPLIPRRREITTLHNEPTTAPERPVHGLPSSDEPLPQLFEARLPPFRLPERLLPASQHAAALRLVGRDVTPLPDGPCLAGLRHARRHGSDVVGPGPPGWLHAGQQPELGLRREYHQRTPEWGVATEVDQPPRRAAFC